MVLLLSLIVSTGCELRPPSTGKSQPGAGSAGPESSAAPASPSVRVLEFIQGGQGAFSLASLKGRVVVLDIAAPWSPATRALVPELNRLHDEQQAAGLSVVGLVVDAKASDGMTPELQELGARYPLVASPRAELGRLTSLRSVPARLLFDRKGQLRKQYPGDISAELLRADIAELIKE